MKERKIITLGLPNSGKSNYIAATIAYMSKYDCGGWRLQNGDINVLQKVDEIQRDFRLGNWEEKTPAGTYKQYTFMLPGSFWNFRREKRVTIIDWSGENFANIVNGGNARPNGMDKFREDLQSADGFMLFVDGEKFLDEKEDGKKERRSLRGIMDTLLSDPSHHNKCSFAIIVTKADFLMTEGVIKFEDILEKFKEKYGALWLTLEDRAYARGLFPVSLVPAKEFQKITPDRGLIPSEKWDLEKVMEFSCVDIPPQEASSWQWYYYQRMYGAFQWLLDIL